jgi:hypothetical protein
MTNPALGTRSSNFSTPGIKTNIAKPEPLVLDEIA